MLLPRVWRTVNNTHLPCRHNPVRGVSPRLARRGTEGSVPDIDTVPVGADKGHGPGASGPSGHVHLTTDGGRPRRRRVPTVDGAGALGAPFVRVTSVHRGREAVPRTRHGSSQGEEPLGLPCMWLCTHVIVDTCFPSRDGVSRLQSHPLHLSLFIPLLI